LSGADGSEIERLDEAGCRCASVTFDQLMPRTTCQEGKDIVVLDRWARTAPRAPFHRSRDRTRVGTMKVAARVPL
jgi:hypothetical protein